jgi:hypothetical protein
MTDNTRSETFDTRDELANSLEKHKQDLKARFCKLMGTDTKRMPIEPDEEWPGEVRELFDEYTRVGSEITQRNLQRGQSQLSAFMKELNSASELSPEAAQWWWDRY